MNRNDLVTAVATRLGSSHTATAEMVDAVLDVIVRTVASGERLSVTGFGAFTKRQRPARDARNPQTGERVSVAAVDIPVFRPGQGFKDLISGHRPMPALDASAVRKASPGSARG